MSGWVSRPASASRASAPGQRIEKFVLAWEASGVRERPPARSKRSRAGSLFLKAENNKRMNMIPSKKILLAFVAGLVLVIGGCSGIKGGTTSGGTGGGTGGGGTGPFTIGGTVVGLKGTGLVIQDNGGDDITFSKDGTFTFKTLVTGPYVVLIKTQPTSTPSQTCSVQNGKGTATATVTNIQVTCGTVYFVGGTINGLAGTGMVLQNNATDDLKITGLGTVQFTFATPVPVGGTYAVTISTPPASPAQACTINNPTGIVNGPVTNIDIVCPQPKYSISGTLIG